MKKLFYFILLSFILIPVNVQAKINLEEMHNSISKNNELEIKSIPLEHYKKFKYYNTCLEEYSDWGDNAQKVCLNLIFDKLVTSYIYKNYNLPKEVSSFAECQSNNNTCDIIIYLSDNSNERLTETYNIKLVEKYDESVENTIKKHTENLKKSYQIDDMGYINQLIHYNEIEKFFGLEQGNIDLFKLYPEIKKHIESNPNIEYIPVFGAGGWSNLNLGAGGVLFAYLDGIAVGMSDNFSYSTYRIVNISDKTENNTEAYINEALKRIKEYVNDDTYNINITYDNEATELNCGDSDCEIGNYKTKIYKLVINNNEYALGISPTDEKNIKKLKIESKDYQNDISVTTESSDVPLDTSVKSKDLTAQYKGFLKAYNIDLYSGLKDEYITKIKDGIIVRIPLPNKYDKNKLDIYHINEDGKKGEKYQAVVEEINGKKYAVFTTNHFSIYAIAEDLEEPKNTITIPNNVIENPQTFDNILNSILIGIVSFIALCGTIYFLLRNNKSKFKI